MIFVKTRLEEERKTNRPQGKVLWSGSVEQRGGVSSYLEGPLADQIPVGTRHGNRWILKKGVVSTGRGLEEK